MMDPSLQDEININAMVFDYLCLTLCVSEATLVPLKDKVSLRPFFL